MKAFYLPLVVFMITMLQVAAQDTRPDSTYPDLHDYGKTIENTIQLNVSRSQYEQIQLVTGSKFNLKVNTLTVNGDDLKPSKINTRGQSTLYFRRKSFAFKLDSVATFRHGAKLKRLNKFELISLSMDKYYHRNRLAFGMMEKLGLFGLFYSFCNLEVNGKSEGIYMIIERPEDWAEKKQHAGVVIRRGYDDAIKKTDIGKGTEKPEIKRYETNFYHVYRYIHKYKEQRLYDSLSRIMDVENYMKWLAFNFLVRNGDYSDEVFFYTDSADGRFRIIPWDYDDLFSEKPHEGNETRNSLLGNKMIFSSEDELDIAIAKDPFLYKRYQQVLKQVLYALPPAVLKPVFEQCFAELYPYYAIYAIISAVQSDAYKDANVQNLRTEMELEYQRLINSRNSCLQAIPGD